jgi:hypothetical protein
MATQRYISTSFWDDPWIYTLDPLDKLLYMYLLTSPQSNIAGVYKCGMHIISNDTKIPDAGERLKRFAKKGKAFFVFDEWVVIPSWPRHQKWQQRSKIKTGIENVLLELPPQLFKALKGMGYQYPMDTLSISYPYDTNYSEFDLDEDFDSDSELNPIGIQSKSPKTNAEIGKNTHAAQNVDPGDFSDSEEVDFSKIKARLRAGKGE